MKTVFITISDGEVAKNILETDVFSVLAPRARVVLLVNPKSVEEYSQMVGGRAVVEAMPRAASLRVDEFFSDLFLYSVPTESILVKVEHSFRSGGSLMGKSIKRVLWTLGHFRWYRGLCRNLYLRLPDRTLDSLFKKHNPDLVFAANLTSSEDARLLKAAKRFKVKSVGLPKGWDNLTLKTLLPVRPDTLLVQTELMRGDAISLDVAPDRVIVVGFPKFDAYADEKALESREEFMARFGFDPNRKLILYAGAGDQLAPHDEEILARYLGAIERGDVSGRPQVLVRPHPKYRYQVEGLPSGSHWALDWPGTRLTKSGDFHFDEDDVAHLTNSLYHCDLLVHTVSTLGVEAAIFDRPSISIAYDGEARVVPGLSVARYYRYDHIQRVMRTGGAKAARSFEELVRYTNAYLSDPSLDALGRERLVAENAGTLDGKAGVRVAHTILEGVGVQP